MSAIPAISPPSPSPTSTPKNKDLANSTPGLTFRCPDHRITRSLATPPPPPCFTPFHPTHTPCHPTFTPGLRSAYPRSPQFRAAYAEGQSAEGRAHFSSFRLPASTSLSRPKQTQTLYYLFALLSIELLMLFGPSPRRVLGSKDLPNHRGHGGSRRSLHVRASAPCSLCPLWLDRRTAFF